MAQRVSSRRRRGASATLEIRLAPKTQAEGFLWSYVWTVEIDARSAAALEALIDMGACRSRIERRLRRILHAAAPHTPPFGPGGLDDYRIILEEAVLRRDLWRRDRVGALGRPRVSSAKQSP